MQSLKLFYRNIGAIVLLLSGVMFAARSGGTAAGSRLGLLLANADGSPCDMPCVLGIRPGMMSLRQAEGILRRHPLVRSLDERACVQTYGWCEFTLRGLDISGLVRSDNNGNVTSVYLLLNDNHALSLGEFISRLGTPPRMIPHFSCCAADLFVRRLEYTTPRYGFWFYYPDQGLLIRDSAQIENGSYRLTPDSPVIDFLVSQPNQLPTNVQRITTAGETWTGFTSIFRYFAAGQHTAPAD
ncbi:MAG: hypothetical protein IT324_06200 [Anaerolineae bacterium]|nr:hypothetical protein [Anaerolineae bacterium]